MTPVGSGNAANTARMIRSRGRLPLHRGSSRRTAAVNRSRPSRRTRARSPAHRSSTTASAAHQVTDRNGLPDAASTAGQAQSARSRIWFTAAVAPVVSWLRRPPRWRSRAQTALARSGS